MIVTLQARNVITIPRDLRNALRLQPGDSLEARVDRGRLVMVPISAVRQTLQLTESGRRKLAEAQADIDAGRISEFASASALLDECGIGGEIVLAGWLRDLLAAYKKGLQSLYGDRLEGFFLFGSQARGDARADSDVDLLIVLDEVPSYSAELERTGELNASLALEYDVSTSRVCVSRADWERGDGPFLATVREDAIAA